MGFPSYEGNPLKEEKVEIPRAETMQHDVRS